MFKSETTDQRAVHGSFQSPGDKRPTRAIFRVSGRLAVVVLERQRLEYPLAKIEISPHASADGFALRLPGGGLFRPNDPASLEVLLDRRLTGHWARRMVVSPPGAIFAYVLLVILAAFSSALLQRDPHELYHQIARSIDPSIIHQVSDRILVTLELQTEPALEVNPVMYQRLEQALASLPPKLTHRVQVTLYRAFPKGFGPDLLVLPDGRLVVCEGLLAALPNDEELRALLILQLTALKLHHLMEEFVRDAPLPWLLQNSSGLEKLVMPINPTLPTRNAVSRALLEREDADAIASMIEAGVDPMYALNALHRLEKLGKTGASMGRWATAQTVSLERRKRFEAASVIFAQTHRCGSEIRPIKCASSEAHAEEAETTVAERFVISAGSSSQLL